MTINVSVLGRTIMMVCWKQRYLFFFITISFSFFIKGLRLFDLFYVFLLSFLPIQWRVSIRYFFIKINIQTIFSSKVYNYGRFDVYRNFIDCEINRCVLIKWLPIRFSSSSMLLSWLVCSWSISFTWSCVFQ